MDMPFSEPMERGSADEETGNSSPKYSEYWNEADRLKTFTRFTSLWPKHKLQTPEALAHAGFVLKGFGGDEVFCFWCGGTLAMWEELDVPMVEHAKHFPDCKFINDVYLSKLRGDYYNLNIKDKQNGELDKGPEVPDLYLYPHILQCLQLRFSREEIQAVFEEFGHEKLDSFISLWTALLYNKHQIHKQEKEQEQQQPGRSTDANSSKSMVDPASKVYQAQSTYKEKLSMPRDSLATLRQRTTCLLCEESFTKPKKLRNCPHVFCFSCLNRYLESSSPNNYPPCPICKKPIVIQEAPSEDEIASFIKPFENCGFCGERSFPKLKCLDCNKKLICEICQASHLDTHPLHTLLSVLDMEVITQGQVQQQCKIHKNQPLDLCCLMCGNVLCFYCENVLHATCTNKFDSMSAFFQIWRKGSNLRKKFLRESEERRNLLFPLLSKCKCMSEEELRHCPEVPPIVLRVIQLEEFVSFSRKYLSAMRDAIEEDITFYEEYMTLLDSVTAKDEASEQAVKRKDLLKDTVLLLSRKGKSLSAGIGELIESGSNVRIAEAAFDIERLCLEYFRYRKPYSLNTRPIAIDVQEIAQGTVVLRQTSSCDFQLLDKDFQEKEGLYHIFVASVESSGINICQDQIPTNTSNSREKLRAIKYFGGLKPNHKMFSQTSILDNTLHTNDYLNEEEERFSNLQCAKFIRITDEFIGDAFQNIIEEGCIVSCRLDSEKGCVYILLKATNTGKIFYYKTYFVNLLSAIPFTLMNKSIRRITDDDRPPQCVCLIGSCDKLSGLESLFLEFDVEEGFLYGVAVNARLCLLRQTSFQDFDIAVRSRFVEHEKKIFSFAKATTTGTKALITYHSKKETEIGHTKTFRLVLENDTELEVPISSLFVDLICETKQGLLFVSVKQDTFEIIVGKLKLRRITKSDDILCSLHRDDIPTPLNNVKPITIAETRTDDLVVVCTLVDDVTRLLLILPNTQTIEMLQMTIPPLDSPIHLHEASISDLEMDNDGNILCLLKDADGRIMRVITKYIMP